MTAYTTVQIRLEVDTGNAGIIEDPLNSLADLFQEQLVIRLRSGCDYGTLRDVNGNTVGSWNLYLDHEGEEETA